MKKIVIFGITGSIGIQTYETIKQLNNYQLVGFTYYKNITLAKEILAIEKNAHVFSAHNSSLNTVNDYDELIRLTKPDLILNAITGFDGIKISFLAAKYDINLALANKESLVAAGKFIVKYQESHPDWKLFPVDSEHSSLYYLHKNNTGIKKIYITASGGPFYNLDYDKMQEMSYSDAIKHPTWQMGEKISIDSATLINKCFELIEAYYLFPKCPIVALYHPQSIVHAMVELLDNSIVANLSYSDMKIPIALALNNYEVMELSKIPSLNLERMDLHFSAIDENKWMPIKWANELIQTSNPTIGAIIVILDDYVIRLFKKAKIKFNDITLIIGKYIKKYKNVNMENIDDLYRLKSLIEADLFLEYGVDGCE